ncbi:MAG: hypothetical protein LBR08_00560 [Bacteroidales bacterium]|nr:hypothetical protein [Bacteroidales bacterium]
MTTTLVLHAQRFPESRCDSPAVLAADSNRLSLWTDMSGFFKNNEYFSPVADGQTYPCISLLPALTYQASGRFRAQAGFYAVKFSGKNDFSHLQPFLRLQYAVAPALQMTLGNLYGGANHRLIEPLYGWERHYVAAPESGLQFVLHDERRFADIWVDWQHYIERGDAAPEALTFGISTCRQLTPPESKFLLKLPLQLLIHHQGGQIDTSDEPMIVLGNFAAGVCSQWQTGWKRLQSVGCDIYATGYYDRYPNEERRPFRQGWGVYPVLHIEVAPFLCTAGYWHGERFYAFQGEALFGSFNVHDPSQQMPVRDLITFKLMFDKEVYQGISVGAQVETYSDLHRGKTDYSFGVHIRCNRQFVLKQL